MLSLTKTRTGALELNPLVPLCLPHGIELSSVASPDERNSQRRRSPNERTPGPRREHDTKQSPVKKATAGAVLLVTRDPA